MDFKSVLLHHVLEDMSPHLAGGFRAWGCRENEENDGIQIHDWTFMCSRVRDRTLLLSRLPLQGQFRVCLFRASSESVHCC